MISVKSKLKTTGFQIVEIAHSISDISQGAQVAPTGVRYLMQPLDEVDIQEIKSEFGINAVYNWQCFYTENGTLITYGADSEEEMQHKFMEFVGTPPPKGLGTTSQRLRRLANVLDDKELERVVMGLLPGLNENGTNQHSGVDIINPKTGGTDPSYILARLKRDNPELAQRITDGEITPHQAAIIAGIRKKRISAAHEPDSVVRMILKYFSEEERRHIANNIV